MTIVKKDLSTRFFTSPNIAHNSLAAVGEKVSDKTGLSPSEMIRLLDSPTAEGADTLFAAARRQRERYFGNTVFLYGFLYISTHCRNRCNFCFYRVNNSRAVRYRKSPSQIVQSACYLAASGVHLIDLTAGEDPFFYDGGENAFDAVVGLVHSIKMETGLPVMASIGVVPETVLNRLASAGTDWYACYQETHNRQLFDRLRVGQDFEARYRSKVLAKAKGMLVEEGLLCGVGETAQDLMDSFDAMAHIGADQVRVMTFVPQIGTPMQGIQPSSSLRECIAIALMRIAFPHLLIPASLDVDGIAGLRQRLDAGANVVTSIVPPGQGLAGVAQSDLNIEDGLRTVESITHTLRACGLEQATVQQYKDWIRQRKVSYEGTPYW